MFLARILPDRCERPSSFVLPVPHPLIIPASTFAPNQCTPYHIPHRRPRFFSPLVHHTDHRLSLPTPTDLSCDPSQFGQQFLHQLHLFPISLLSPPTRDFSPDRGVLQPRTNINKHHIGHPHFSFMIFYFFLTLLSFSVFFSFIFFFFFLFILYQSKIFLFFFFFLLNFLLLLLFPTKLLIIYFLSMVVIGDSQVGTKLVQVSIREALQHAF